MSAIAGVLRRLRPIVNVTIVSVLIVFAMVVVLDNGRGRIGATILPALRGSFPIAFCIAGISWLVMPRVASRIETANPFVRWPIYLATMTVTAMLGTVAAGLLYFYGFAVAHDRTFVDLILQALRVSIPVTLIAGSIITIIGSAMGRLRATELALRTQQLDKERAERLAAEAQFASLASHVQPHFLFNTLNSIAALVRENPREAEAMIERLASLLRSSLDVTQTVPVEKELNLVTSYLEIQKTRFGGRLSYEISSAPDSSSTLPPFAIQTVVENSIKHVAGSRLEGVSVRVAATRQDSELIVDITDNGPGFAPDAMKAGHGLDNLQGRLRAAYGSRAAIEYLREPGAMTVRLRVPEP
jgi:sensor histidine kinase YesM